MTGDFNVLEPSHVPRYHFFAPFEYEFYDWFAGNAYTDAFRHLHPDRCEYSWVGRTGDGYRYDHAHVSLALVDSLTGCSYVHEPRVMAGRLTDHSALSVRLAATATGRLPVTAPGTGDLLPSALF
ncbi:hypothetical protein ABZX40_38335 [Streptomyces sp. NPDC004610]|uniref:hypothetical protein n=1 Tax=unclassified Streptomyces TaxID=2593676 RepID=UPI0033BC4FAC